MCLRHVIVNHNQADRDSAFAKASSIDIARVSTWVRVKKAPRVGLKDFKMYKACASCGQILEIAEFPYSVNCRTFKHYPMRDCKVCKSYHARTLRSLQKIFPKPPEGSRCDLCNRSEKRLFLDHDHNLTGPESFRGYLCLRCNVSATSYSIPELEQTIAYLRRSNTRTTPSTDDLFSDSEASTP
jgi:hypothetical protein